MNPTVSLHFNDPSHSPYNNFYACISRIFHKNERKLLKLFLLGSLHKLLCELYSNATLNAYSEYFMENYAMDSKIIQLLIQNIVETGEYTLEGIANHTRIPFDVIVDAACGNNNQLSVTFWIKIVDLYMQVKPEIARMLFDKLLMIKEKNSATLSLLLNEQ